MVVVVALMVKPMKLISPASAQKGPRILKRSDMNVMKMMKKKQAR